MNNVNEGDRVVSVRPLTGIPVGTRGTVTAVLAFTVEVLFDGHSGEVIVTPMSIRKLSARFASETKVFRSLSDLGSDLMWLDPVKRPPATASHDDIVAVTATPNVVSILFNDAMVAVRADAFSGTWIGSAEFPISGGGRRLRAQVRGFVEHDERSRATAILDIGGSLHVLRFDNETGMDEIELTIGAVDIVTITLVLIAERQPGSTNDALIAVDSIDIVVA